MDISTNNKVNSFLADIESISPEQFELLISIRKLFLKANKEFVEEIKYGGLVFNLSNKLMGGVFPYKAHLSIEFSNGVSFTDPDSLLEGKGKMRRHLKIYSNTDIIDKKCFFYIKQINNNI